MNNYNFELTDIKSISDTFPQKRDCLEELQGYLCKESTTKICILYGLRRTGKTVLLKQALHSLEEKEREKSAFITCNSNTDFYDVLNFIKESMDNGKRYFCIDEITYAKNFQNLAEILSDNFVSNYNARIILTGTDSLGLSLPSHSNLYDRAEFVHTTYMAFPEFSRIMNNDSIDFYIKHGNTLSEMNPFEDYNSANEYIETSIVSNMISSLQKSEGIRSYPPALTELYKNEDLENAIQRIINQYSQTITMRALRKQFELSPFENGVNALTKRDKDNLDLKSKFYGERITENAKRALKIDNFKTPVSQQHLDDIKDFLKEMDVILTIPVFTSYKNGNKDVDMEIITHPGMYHANLMYTIDELRKDDNWLPNATKGQKEGLLKAVYECSAGKILENFVIADIFKMLGCTKSSSYEDTTRWYVSKFSHTVQGVFEEADLIIHDRQQKDVFLFEIKHSSEIHESQTKHLESKSFIEYIENNFDTVKEKVVLYTGKNNSQSNIKRLNVSDFLKHMYKHCQKENYSVEDTIQALSKSRKNITITKENDYEPER